MTYAQLADVELDYGEPIEAADMDKVLTLLDRAEARIRLPDAFPDLDERVSSGTTPLVLVKQVECEMVCAVLRNPGCYQSESRTIGSESSSYSLNLAAASGLLRLGAEHRVMLSGAGAAPGSGSRVGCIAPSLQVPPASAYLPPLNRDPLCSGGDWR